MPVIDFIWVLLGFMVYVMGVIVQATHTSVLQELLTPVDNRYMIEQKRSHHSRHSTHSTHFSRVFQDYPTECCPSIKRTIAPLGGLSREGTLLQLYRTAETVQKFYETTCAHNVENRPCHFIDQSEWRSICEQKTSYTYAIVKDFNVTEDHRIDYMKINSGCSCTILGPTRPPAVNLQSEILHELEESGILDKK